MIKTSKGVNILDKLVRTIDFAQAPISISDILDVFLVWSRDLETSELIPLKLFTDKVDAKTYRDTIINDSHKLEDVIVVGYSCRHLFDEGHIL